ncbi:MAG: cell division protein ZapA [Paramuribaculum sp.]|nr:cell division protein ZapA [Paramuribaculum sp.]MDE6460721.1 cell division protein ZapA [Paramuribaculum sp.]MDE6651446.1 cell division protein ZapA [Paramuribaculum sp.]
MKDKIDINLRIADVALSLTINPDEERLLREAAKGINEAWSSWRSRFKTKSPAEVLAMVTLLFTKSYLDLKEQTQRTDEVLDSLERTIDMLLLENDSSGMNES